MKSYSLFIFVTLFLWFVTIFLNPVYSQDTTEDSVKVISFPVAENTLPPAATKIIELLDFKNAELQDVMRAIASKYGLNIFIEDDIQRRITIHLVQIPVYRALKFIAGEYGLVLKRDGNIFKLEQPLSLPPEPEPLKIDYQNGLLSIDLQNADLREAVEEISKISGQNIVINQGVEGKISGFLQSIPFEQGLPILMNINGFSVRKANGVFLIDRNFTTQESNSSLNSAGRFWVGVKDSLITLDVSGASIRDVLREIFMQMGMDVIMYDEVKGHITARCSNISLEESLNYLLKGTKYTYRKEGNIYLIGGQSLQGIISARLIPLNHLTAEKAMDLLPESIIKNATIKTVKEHNGLIVLGTQEIIKQTENFIEEIDRSGSADSH